MTVEEIVSNRLFEPPRHVEFTGFLVSDGAEAWLLPVPIDWTRNDCAILVGDSAVFERIVGIRPGYRLAGGSLALATNAAVHGVIGASSNPEYSAAFIDLDMVLLGDGELVLHEVNFKKLQKPFLGDFMVVPADVD